MKIEEGRWDISKVKHPVLRGQLEAFAAMTDEELERFGLNSKIRDKYLEHVVVPEGEGDEVLDLCWGWTGMTVNDPPRGIIWGHKTNLYIYRISFAMANGWSYSQMRWVRHLCPGKPCPLCSNPRHLAEGNAKDDANDRRAYGSILCGDRSPSRLRPETRPRGLKHSKCPFADGKPIQAIRATFDQNPGVIGLIAALARHFKVSGQTITAIVRRVRYLDIPDDAGAALKLSMLDLRGPGRSGDSSGKTRLPTAAAELFYLAFKLCPFKRERRKLIEYVMEQFGVAKSYLQDIGYGRARRKFTAPLVPSLAGRDPILKCNRKFLVRYFAGLEPLRRGQNA